MSNRKFVIRMIISAVVLLVCTVVMLLVFENTVITNDIALGQMSNSNEAYLLMEYYNRIRIVASIVYSCVSALIIGIATYNICKFIKTKIQTKNEGEN